MQTEELGSQMAQEQATTQRVARVPLMHCLLLCKHMMHLARGSGRKKGLQQTEQQRH